MSFLIHSAVVVSVPFIIDHEKKPFTAFSSSLFGQGSSAGGTAPPGYYVRLQLRSVYLPWGSIFEQEAQITSAHIHQQLLDYTAHYRSSFVGFCYNFLISRKNMLISIISKRFRALKAAPIFVTTPTMYYLRPSFVLEEKWFGLAIRSDSLSLHFECNWPYFLRSCRK